MSSDNLHRPIESIDLKLIRDVPTEASFGHAEQTTENDRDAASFLIAQCKHGVSSLEGPRSALTHRALPAEIRLNPSQEAHT